MARRYVPDDNNEGDATCGDVMQIMDNVTGEWEVVPIPPALPRPATSQLNRTVSGTRIVYNAPVQGQGQPRRSMDDDYRTQEFQLPQQKIRLGGEHVIGRDLYDDRMNYNYPRYPMTGSANSLPVKTIEKKPRAPRPEDQRHLHHPVETSNTKKRLIGACGLLLCGVLGWAFIVQPAWNAAQEHWHYGDGAGVNQGTVVISNESYTVMSWYIPSDGINPGDITVSIQSADAKKHQAFDYPVPALAGDHKKSVLVRPAKGSDGKVVMFVTVDGIPSFSLIDDGHQGFKIKQ